MESHATKEKMDELTVNKHKRNHDASGSGESSSSDSISSKSEGSKGKVDDHVDMPAHAPGENNGCDDIEKLISCKTCSHTYHVRCLSPPLESIPEDWQCINCTDNVDLLEPIVNFKKPKKERNFSSNCSICSRGTKKLRLPEDKDVQSKSLKSSSADDVPNSQVESNKNEIGEQEGATFSDPGICALNQINHDILLMPRKNSEACNNSNSEALNKSAEEARKPEEKAGTMRQADQEKVAAKQARRERLKNSKAIFRRKSEACKSDSKALNKSLEKPHYKLREKEATRQQLHPEKAAVALKARKERLYMLRVRQKQKLKSREKGQVTPTKHAGIGGESLNSFGKSLCGWDKTPPNTLHLENGSASGSTPRPSIIIPKRVDTTTGPMSGSASGSTPMPSIPGRVDTTKTATAPRRPSGLLRITPKPATWSDFELDALWVGVRRHGQGNWEKMLADPLLAPLRNKTPEHLSKRWEKETQKIFPSAVPLPMIKNVVPTTTNIERSAPPHHHVLERNNIYSLPDRTTSMLMQRAMVNPHPHISGNKWYPYGIVENQGLMWMTMNMPSVKNEGISSCPSYIQGYSQMVSSAPQWVPTTSISSGPSYIQGSSSQMVSSAPQWAPAASSSGPPYILESSQIVASAPQWAPATSTSTTTPLASQILARNNNQRNSTTRSSNHDDDHALRAAIEKLISSRKKNKSASSTSAEPANDEPKLLLGGLFTLPKVVVIKKKSNTTEGNSNERGTAKANSSYQVEADEKGKEPATSSEETVYSL